MTTVFAANLIARFRDLFLRLFNEVPFLDYVAALLFLFAGLVAGKLVYVITVALLEFLRFDRFGERLGLYELFDEHIRETPARIVGRVLYWSTVAIFLAAAIDVLQIVDVPLRIESFAGLTARLFSYGIILVLADLLGRFAGGMVDALLRIVAHPAGGRSSRVVHGAVLLATATVNLDVLGLGTETTAGAALLGILAALALAAGISFIVPALRRFNTNRKLESLFRVGDRITLQDGRAAVVRSIEPEHLIVATEADEWILPAAWVLEAPVRREEL